MNVLSLFDGISCGQIALERTNIKVDNYFASEIDKHAIKVTQHNYPKTIQLGNISEIKGKNLPKIDLLMGGSPCQGFSFAGKQLNFEDPRSKLFFEYIRILKEINPKYFLLENVKMKKDYQKIITNILKVEPVEINSSIVSAQDRKRLYWTNIPFNFQKIPYKNIYLKEILEEKVSDKLFLIDKFSNRFIATKNPIKNKNKSNVIGKLSEYQGDRIFSTNSKGSSLSACGGNNGGGGCNIIFDKKRKKLRRLSIIECERLQTIPDNYTKTEEKSNRYKMIGNGWTVDVIVYILKGIKE